MKTIKCIVCNSSQIKIFAYQKFDYYKCRKCGLISTHPFPTKQVIKNHYKKRFQEGNYKLLRDFASQYKTIYIQFADIIENSLKKINYQSKKPLKVLDVGCFTGEFLLILKKRGFDVYGVELQTEAAQIAQRKLGNSVINTDISVFKAPRESFDIITLQGLLEHVEDPQKLIKQCSKYLKADGILMIQTPNSGSVLAGMLGKYWPPYSPVEHIHLFSKKSLTILLNREGFRIIEAKSHWKKLPVGYVYNMFSVFGNEFQKISKPVYEILPERFKKTALPFYIGEMIIIAQKVK